MTRRWTSLLILVCLCILCAVGAAQGEPTLAAADVQVSLNGAPQSYCPGMDLFAVFELVNTLDQPLTDLRIEVSLPQGGGAPRDMGSTVSMQRDTSSQMVYWVLSSLDVDDAFVAQVAMAGPLDEADGPVALRFVYASEQVSGERSVSYSPSQAACPPSLPDLPTATPTLTLVPVTPTATQPAVPTATPGGSPTVTPTYYAAPTPYVPSGALIYPAVNDTTLDQWLPDTSYGQDPILVVRQGRIRVALLRFDLSDIPVGTEVEIARLQLYVNHRTNTGHLDAELYALSRAWDEMEADWINALSLETWQAGGCSGSQDRTASPILSLTMDADLVWLNLDITDLAQSWVDSPSTNYGVLLEGDGSVSVQYELTSSEGLYPQQAPRLMLDLDGNGPAATSTQVPSVTPTSTATPTQAVTRTRSATVTTAPSSTPTLTQTSTMVPSLTPSRTATNMPSNTPTGTRSTTPTATAVTTVTPKPTHTLDAPSTPTTDATTAWMPTLAPSETSTSVPTIAPLSRSVALPLVVR